MQIKFLGGASYVGSLGMLLKDQEPMLFDYGFLPMKPPQFPMKAPPVDTVFLTHCHIDHSGMIPWVGSRYDSVIHATPITMEVSKLLFDDSLKIASSEGFPQPYNKSDIRKTMSNFQPVDFGTSVNAGGYEVRVHSAGHVPGAAMYEIVGHDTTVFTGDLNTLSTHLVYGVQPVKCDNLIVETTYAGRSHPDRLKLEYSFVRKIKEITSRGGKAIIPAFAVGRTQELLLILRSEKFDVQLDGMGSSINRMYLRWPKYLRSAKNLRAAVRKADVVKRARDKLDYDCDVIVTTSGMLDGGPVLEYIQRFKDDSRNGILLTGYQVEGTNGRMLMEEGKISLYGSEEKIKAEVEYFDLSAHAGHDDLVRFINDCDPERVILMHGDNRQLIADELEGREIIIPKEGEWTDI